MLFEGIELSRPIPWLLWTPLLSSLRKAPSRQRRPTPGRQPKLTSLHQNPQQSPSQPLWLLGGKWPILQSPRLKTWNMLTRWSLHTPTNHFSRESLISLTSYLLTRVLSWLVGYSQMHLQGGLARRPSWKLFFLCGWVWQRGLLGWPEGKSCTLSVRMQMESAGGAFSQPTQCQYMPPKWDTSQSSTSLQSCHVGLPP
jgi:hypothetical protein